MVFNNRCKAISLLFMFVGQPGLKVEIWNCSWYRNETQKVLLYHCGYVKTRSNYKYLFKDSNKVTRTKSSAFPASIYLLKVYNRNTEKSYEICSKLAQKRPKRLYWRRSGLFIVNFEHVLHLFLVLLWTSKFF